MTMTMTRTMAKAVMLLWAACLWQPAAAQTTVKYVHTDALGSVVALTGSGGAVLEGREYEPYGYQATPVIQDGPGYTGHVQDAATGLTYMQQRYYDPQIGVFLSVDPVTALSDPVGHFNPYRYANNNPYKFIDPDGRFVRNKDRPERDEIDPIKRMMCEIACLAGGDGNGSPAGQSNRSPEEQDYYAERAKTAERAEETFKEVGVFIAKEAGGMLAFAKIGKLLGNVGGKVGGLFSARERLVGRVLKADGTLNTSKTVVDQLSRQRSYIPVQGILETIRGGTRVADPQGVPGQFMYRSSVSRGPGGLGTLEVLVHESSGTIRHVMYMSD